MACLCLFALKPPRPNLHSLQAACNIVRSSSRVQQGKLLADAGFDRGQIDLLFGCVLMVGSGPGGAFIWILRVSRWNQSKQISLWSFDRGFSRAALPFGL